MTLETWMAFVVTYTIISIIPGPSVFMVLAQSISRGLYPALLCVFGDVTGGVFVMTLSYAGVGAILAASEELFQLMKWAGVLYIAYLGCSQIKEARRLTQKSLKLDPYPKAGSRSMRAGFFTGLLNPKAIVFYMAFLSQFIDSNAQPLAQFSILMLTASTIVLVVLGGYAMLAVKVRSLFHSLQTKRRMGFLSGGFLLGGSILMALAR